METRTRLQNHDIGGPYGEQGERRLQGNPPPEWLARWAEEQARAAKERRTWMETRTEKLAEMAIQTENKKDPSPHFKLSKMSPTDDPEAYINSFEKVAKAASWPKEQWAIILGPYLTGEALLAVDILPPWEQTDYERVKQSILGTRKTSEETYVDREEECEDEYRVCFKGSKRGQGRRARGIRDPFKESAWTQSKEEWSCLQWQFDGKHERELELLRSSLLYQHQEDLRKLERDLSDRYTSEIEELKWKHEVRLGELLMVEDKYHEQLDVLEAQKQTISTQQEEIEKLEKENARLRKVGDQEEKRLRKELEQIKCKLIVEHADKVRQARKEAQEWKAKWEDLEKTSEEKLLLIYKDLENKAKIEEQVFQQQYELREVEMIGLQKQQTVRIVELEKSLEEQQNRVQQLEAQVKQLGEQSLKDLAVMESSFKAALKGKEQEVERLSDQVKTLQMELEETKQQQNGKLMVSAEDVKCAASEKEQIHSELTMEKVSKVIREVQLQDVSKGLGGEVSVLRGEVTTVREFVEEQDLELETGQLKYVSHDKVPGDLQKTISKRQGTSETLGGVLTKLDNMCLLSCQFEQESAVQEEQLVWIQQQEMTDAEDPIGDWMPMERFFQLWRVEKDSLEHYKKRSMHPDENFVSQQETGPTSREVEDVAPVLLGGVCREVPLPWGKRSQLVRGGVG